VFALCLVGYKTATQGGPKPLLSLLLHATAAHSAYLKEPPLLGHNLECSLTSIVERGDLGVHVTGRQCGALLLNLRVLLFKVRDELRAEILGC
jgi:hypothetical protein